MPLFSENTMKIKLKKKKKTMEKNRKNSFNHVFHCYLADYWEFVWYDIMKAMH